MSYALYITVDNKFTSPHDMKMVEVLVEAIEEGFTIVSGIAAEGTVHYVLRSLKPASARLMSKMEVANV